MIDTMISSREAMSSLMLIRKATIRPATVRSEVAWPRPQKIPMREERRHSGSPLTMVDTATT
jgi:hypothetical protein